jgi:hypothetical protein
MRTTSVLAIFAAVTAALAWWTWDRPVEFEAPANDVSTASPASALPSAEFPGVDRAAAVPEPDHAEILSTVPGSSSRSVLVQTVDTEGRPLQGIPLVWGERADAARPIGEAVFTTGLAATARIDLPDPGEHPRVWVHALVLAERRICEPIPDATVDEAPLRLTVPSHGIVRIDVDPGIPDVERVSLTVARTAAEIGIRSFDGRSLPHQWRDVQDATATFEHVALGLNLEVQVWGESGGGRHPRKFAGPVAPGQTVVFRLSEAGVPALSGRILDPSGAPMTAKRFRVKLESSSMNRGFSLRTNDAGRFRIELEDRGLRSLTLLPMEERATGSFGSEQEDYSRRVRRMLPAEVHGDLDLGDLRLEPSPILAAGRVTDRSGVPISGVNLHVEVLLMERPGTEDVFDGVQDARAVSGEDGSFTVFGDPPQSRVRLTAYSQEHLAPPPLPFLAGDEQLLVVVHRAGALAGSVLFPDRLERVGIVASLHPPPAGQQAEVDVTPNRDGRGSFRWRPLPPGVYDLRLQIGEGYEPFHVVPGVTVTEGEAKEDPRLRDVRIEDFLDLAEIRLRTADGSPLPGMVTLYTMAAVGNGASGKGVPVKDGLVRMLCRPEAPADVAIGADGFQVVLLPAFAGSTDAVLTPAFDLVVRVTGSEPLRNEHGGYQLLDQWFTPDGEVALLAGSARSRGAHEPDASREIRVRVQRPGELRLMWSLPQPDAKWTLVAGPRILVEAGDAGRVVEIPAPELPNR